MLALLPDEPAPSATWNTILPPVPVPVPCPALIVKSLPAVSVPLTAADPIVALAPFPNVISLPVTVKSVPTTTLPLPLGVKLILPFAPSVIVIFPVVLLPV